MKTFQDLMNDGCIYNRQTVPQTGGTGRTTDEMCRMYNMYWGPVTDTHMNTCAPCDMFNGQADQNGYIIVGTKVANTENMRTLFSCRRWENCEFPEPFNDILASNGLTSQFVNWQGQAAILVTHVPPAPED